MEKAQHLSILDLIKHICTFGKTQYISAVGCWLLSLWYNKAKSLYLRINDRNLIRIDHSIWYLLTRLALHAHARSFDADAEGRNQHLEQRIPIPLRLARHERWRIGIKETDLVNWFPDFVQKLQSKKDFIVDILITNY